MTELNFCPLCGSHSHKLLECSDNFFYCRDCSKFFSAKDESISCPQCSSKHIRHNDFPSIEGKLVFQCMRCTKLSTISEIFDKKSQ